MDLGVSGKLYICVGGSRGMGWEAARALAAEGADLVLVSRTESAVQTAAGELAEEFGVRVDGVAADGSQATELEDAIAGIIERRGAPRGLLVTSGLTDRNGDLQHASDADWEANYEAVLMGTVRACRAVVPAMVANGGGQIVTTAAYSARAAKSFLFPYASMKAAVINFTKNLAKTYGAQGIRSNCVCPGAFETDRVIAAIEAAMADRGLNRADASAYVMTEQYKMPVGLQRPGLPHEAGELMAFLLSERAAYLNGAIVNIDGGTDF